MPTAPSRLQPPQRPQPLLLGGRRSLRPSPSQLPPSALRFEIFQNLSGPALGAPASRPGSAVWGEVAIYNGFFQALQRTCRGYAFSSAGVFLLSAAVSGFPRH